MANSKTTAAAPKDTVRIKLPLTKTEKDDVYVCLNGYPYLIQRGVEVEVPRGVAKILEQKERMLARAIKFDEEAAGDGEK